jgi:hypothetical protein
MSSASTPNPAVCAAVRDVEKPLDTASVNVVTLAVRHRT